MLRTFLQVASAGFALFAGILLVRGSFVLKPKDIAELSSTYWGFNKSLVESLSQQQIDAKLGVGLLLFSFLLQTINLCWPMTIDELGAANRAGTILGVLVPFIFFLAALWISNALSERTQKQVAEILKTRE